MRAALAAFSPGEPPTPACGDVNTPLTGLGECNDYNRMVSLNPRFFDASLSEGAVQLIVVSTRDGTANKEDRRHAELR